MDKHAILSVMMLLLVITPVLSADGYTVSVSQNLNINEHGNSTNVENLCADPLFVPTKTAAEWYTGGDSFIQNPPACVNIYCGNGVVCGTRDCSSNDNYYITGTQSAYYTSYCRFEQYNDVDRICDGSGGCVNTACNDFSTTTTVTAGACRYVSGCSGSTSGSLAYYSSGTACSGTTNCDPNNYYYQDGTNGPNFVSYCKYRDYSDVSNTCNGFGSCTSGSCTSYIDSTTGTAGSCKYVSVGSGGSSCSVQNYGSGTACSGTTNCDSNDEYFITGTQSATSTSYCTYRDYSDVSNTCNGAGTCTEGFCDAFSDSTTVTAGTCRYVSGCSGSTSGSLAYYSSGTSCGTNLECDGSGNCVSAYTWSDPGSWISSTCEPHLYPGKQTGSCSPQGATHDYASWQIIDYSCPGGEPRVRVYRQTCG